MEDIKTNDLVFASTLSAFNFPLKELEGPIQSGDRKVFNFVFSDDPKIQDLIDQYRENRLLIEPKRYTMYYKELKRKIFDALPPREGSNV